MNEYEMAGIIGGCLIGFWVAGVILSRAGAWCWAWVDDSEETGKNLVYELTIRKIMPTEPTELPDGWKKSPEDSMWKYYKGADYGKRTDYTDYIRKSAEPDEDVYVFGLILSLGLLPTLTLIAFKFYPVAIGIVLAWALAHTARMARRGGKMLSAHIKDKDAHKDTK